MGQTTNKKKPSAGLERTKYRPVINLGFISKIVEKVILPTYQSAYSRNHSCETSLVKLVDDIMGNEGTTSNSSCHTRSVC